MVENILLYYLLNIIILTQKRFVLLNTWSAYIKQQQGWNARWPVGVGAVPGGLGHRPGQQLQHHRHPLRWPRQRLPGHQLPAQSEEETGAAWGEGPAGGTEVDSLLQSWWGQTVDTWNGNEKLIFLLCLDWFPKSLTSTRLALEFMGRWEEVMLPSLAYGAVSQLVEWVIQKPGGWLLFTSVSLGKTLNPKMHPMSMEARCMAAAAHWKYERLCEWVH